MSVVVTDVRMPFLSMVVFIIKWAVAAIPAMIILAVIWVIFLFVISLIFGGLLTGLSGLHNR